MRILIYTQFCVPEPIFKSVPFARELKSLGHDVRILTGLPNYPGGKVYAGYSMKLWQREVIDGIRILRTGLYPSHDKSALRRMVNYGSFTATSAWPLWFGWRPDVIYVYNLVTLGAVASIRRWFRRTPFVIDVQDLWPDSIMRAGMGNLWVKRTLDSVCQKVYRQASRVVALSPGMASLVCNRASLPIENTEVIYNWCDEGELLGDAGDSLDGVDLGFAGKFNIVFAGNLGSVQGLESVVDAAAEVAQTHPYLQFVFLGKGVMLDALKSRAYKVAPQNTLFLEARPMSEAAKVLRMADVLLIHLQRDPLFEITIPSKTQAYLAMGKPILAAVVGDAADLVVQAKAGIACQPESPVELAAAAIRLADMPKDVLFEMGENGSRFYKSELSIEVGVEKFHRLFLDIAGADSM